MAIIKEGIAALANGSLSFGNYEATDKIKVDDFACAGDVYKVRTHSKVTRLECNGKLLIETIPGAAMHEMTVSDMQIRFIAEGLGDTQITMELEAEKEYRLAVDDASIGTIKTNRSGKVTFNLELGSAPRAVTIDKLV